LTHYSPCIDSGANAGVYTDIDGEIRPLGWGYDMGSDEFGFFTDLCPVLDSAALEPAAGHTRTTFRFTLHYRDEDGDAPTVMNIVIDGIPQDMSLLDGSTADGTYYQDIRLGIGTHQYYYSFYDGAGCQTRLPADGYFEGPFVERGNALYVPGDYATIQEALDDCVDGEEIIVRDGVYTGAGNKNLSFLGKALTLRSENGPQHCILDCEGAGRGFVFNDGEEAASIVDGFTIVNGSMDDRRPEGTGGGILCENHSSPSIFNCVITGNSADWGGGIYCKDYSSPTIANCSVMGNSADWAGGIYCDYKSDATIKDCTIKDNSARFVGGIYISKSSAAIFNCAVIGNSSDHGVGGISNFNYTGLVLTISGCTISDNHKGGISNGGDCRAVVTNSIVWGNSEYQIDGYPTYPTHATVAFSNIQGGHPGYGNISTDPLFVSGPLGDFYLSQIAAGQSADSPCVDAGIGTASYFGLDTYTTRIDEKDDDGQVDMGYHYPEIPELTGVNCISPPNEAILYSPPTFSWTANGGTNNVFAVDLSYDWTFSSPYWSTYENMRQLIEGTSWALPDSIWSRIPPGSYVYWRVRGADLDESPLAVLFTYDYWWFYKP